MSEPRRSAQALGACMSENLCAVCARPLPDQAYACHICAQDLAETLTTAAGHAEDAESVLARQSRFGAGSRGGGSDGLSYDATRALRLHTIQRTADRWISRLLAGAAFPPWRRPAGPPCETGVRCPHTSCAAIRVTTPPPMLAREFSWLSVATGRLARHPAPREGFRELHDACDDLARLVDVPADKELVGMCDCGKVLYAARGRSYVQCPEKTCARRWHVERSRDILRRALGDKLVTVSDAARLAAYLDSKRTQDAIRKLVASRIGSGQLVAHGVLGGEPVFRFGEVVAVLASIPIRKRRAAA